MKSNSLSITLLAAGLAAGWVGAATLPNGLPILNSKPSAPVAFFLDFSAFGGFDRDGDPTTFNASEQAEIEHAWAQTATAYSPYDANVTTISPAAGVPFTWIGIGTDGGNGSAGTRFFIPWSAQPSSPVARLGSWRLPGANTIIHEGNHSIGIGHSFYYDDKLSLVIAQFIHGERRAAWTTAAGSMGEFKNGLSQYGTPSNPAGYYWPIRDIDFICKAVINATKTYVDAGYTGDGLRPDDHGDDIAHATPLVPGSGILSADGVIERQTDKDVFSFAWGGGEIWVGVQASLPRAQLDARITLRDAAGNLIAHADPPNQWDAAVHIDDLPAGSYFAEVASDGDYSDLGWYRVTAAGDPPPFLQPVASLDFEDSPGATTFADASTYGHDGQLDLNGGVATPASGPDASGALNLSGPARVLIQQHGKSLNNQYGALATGADGLTFALAFRPDNAEAAGKQVLIDAYNGTGIVIYLEGGRLKAHAYRAAGSISPESNCTLASTPVSSHEWHHLTVSLFQTSGRVDDAMRLYLDGQLVARGTAAEVTEIGPTIAIGNASGVVRFPDGTTTYTGFGGAIDRFRFYHEVLPDPMIADLALRPDLRQPAPTGTAVAGSATPASDSVTLNWNPVAGATAYQILRSEDAQHYAPIALLDAAATAFHDPGLEPSHRYFYCVAAQGAEGVATIETKTRAAAPILAGLLPVQKANADPDYQWTDYERWGNHAEGIHGITLNWVQPQGDADRQIRIERSTDGVNFTPLRTMSSLYTVYYDNTVAPDTVYTYRLVSIDEQGDAGSIRFLAQSTGPNRAPVLVAPVGAVAFDEYGTAIVIDLSSVFADAQVAPLQMEVTANDNPGFVTAALDGTLLTLTCAPGALGSATLTVRATDIGGLETANTFTVTRTSLPTNPPPLLGTPVTTAIFADGATVTCPLSQAPATTNTVVWAYADQGDSDVAAWQGALGGGFHQVTVSIPRTLAGDGEKLFARLKVVVGTTP